MKKILILDLETTGFLDRGGKIVEVGIVELDLDSGEANIIFDKVVHEDGISENEVAASWIVNNSDLTTEEVMSSPSLSSVKAEIQAIIDSYPLGATAFNNQFDFGFMQSRGFTFPKKLACPMLLSTNICKIPSHRGYKWPKVQEAYDFFVGKNDYVEKHRGADDAKHEAVIVQKLYEMGVFTL